MFYIPMLVDEGKKLEKELNNTGPGEAFYIKCDVSKEDEIKVREVFFGLNIHTFTQAIIMANTLASWDFCNIILPPGIHVNNLTLHDAYTNQPECGGRYHKDFG